MQAVIASGYIAQKSQVRKLESVLSDFVGKKYGIAVSSGTSALILALKVLKIKSGDEVIIPSYTCSALWHAVRAVEAIPVLADIETDSYNLDPHEVKSHITGKTKAVIFPHMFGQPGYIQEIIRLGVPVIEDIAQAIGATIDNQPVGSLGILSIVSFYATKVLGAGEGGMIFTDESTPARYLRDIREYDEKAELIPRLNAKMSDITAAIALSQFEKLPEFTTKRRHILAKYRTVADPQIILPNRNPHFQSNFFRCIAACPHQDADQLIQTAREQAVMFRKPVFKPIHAYLGAASLPNTEAAWQKQVSVPLFPAMNDREIKRVTTVLKKLGDSDDR